MLCLLSHHFAYEDQAHLRWEKVFCEFCYTHRTQARGTHVFVSSSEARSRTLESHQH